MNPIVLAAEQLSIRYKDRVILRDIDLQFEKGKMYAIIGANGCGKTSLIRTISRNARPASGKVLLNGRDIFRTNTRKVAQSMAVLAQINNTMSDVTVRALVQFGRYAHKEWWRGSSKDSEIVDWALAKTNMIHLAERRINTLSGGERQRAWIAMCIAQKPQILLLDEPTTYLDISHQLEIMELVRSLNQEEGITIVMVLHDINHAARYSDELIVLNEGRVFRQGDPWSILESDVLRRVFRVESVVTMDQENKHPIFYARKVVD